MKVSVKRNPVRKNVTKMAAMNQTIEKCRKCPPEDSDPSIRKIVLGINRRVYYVRCHLCGSNGDHRLTNNEAVEVWNREFGCE